MGQFLYELGAVCGYALAELEGGQKDNALQRECQASILVAAGGSICSYLSCRKNAEGFPGGIHRLR